MRIREVGAHAVLVELGDVDEVWAWQVALVTARDDGRLPGVEEIVPGVRTVLLDGVESPPTVAAELATWEVAQGEAPAPGPLVEIPTFYDGEDLPWVAEQWGVNVEGAVAEQSGTDLRAALRVRPGLRLPGRAPTAAAPAPPGDPATRGSWPVPWPWRASTPRSTRRRRRAAGT